MIIATNESNVVTGGNIKPKITDFHIAATAHAFKILSDSLYSDKIAAVIRELSTNAYDAHVYVGRGEVPFLVTLPNSLNPTFSVRDYGPGMTRQEIEKLYTTYFKSGEYKLESNDYVGCLGLGSKSPFAYTSVFTVTSFQNGKKHCYSAFLSENGIPKCQFLGTTDTDEPDGLLVSLPVKTSDFTNFCNTAARIYTYFQTIPSITGNSYCKPQRVVYTTTDHTTYGVRSDGNNNHARIIMGNISYAVGGVPMSISTKAQQVLNSPIDLFFNVGEIEITPNREGISYTPSTIKVINERCEQVLTTFEKHINDEIAKCATLWEARTKFAQLYSLSNTCIGRMINYKKISWQGKNIVDDIDGSNILINIDRKQFDDTVLKVTEFTYREYGRTKYKVKDVNHIVSSYYRRSIFIENDGSKLAIARCKERIARGDKISLYLLNFATPEARKYFMELIGLSDKDVLKLNVLPKPSVNRYGHTKYANTAKVFKFNMSCYDGMVDYKSWQEYTTTITNDGITVYYIPMSRYKSLNSNGTDTENYKLSHLIRLWREVSNNDTLTVVGVRKDLLAKIRLPSNWVLWQKHLTTLFTPEVLRLLTVRKEVKNLHNENAYLNLAKALEGSGIIIPDTDPLKSVVDLCTEYLDGCKKYQLHMFQQLFDYLDTLQLPVLDIDLTKQITLVHGKYCLFDVLFTCYDMTYHTDTVSGKLKAGLRQYIEKMI